MNEIIKAPHPHQWDLNPSGRAAKCLATWWGGLWPAFLSWLTGSSGRVSQRAEPCDLAVRPALEYQGQPRILQVVLKNLSSCLSSPGT